jgi:hypothetical protein
MAAGAASVPLPCQSQASCLSCLPHRVHNKSLHPQQRSSAAPMPQLCKQKCSSRPPTCVSAKGSMLCVHAVCRVSRTCECCPCMHSLWRVPRVPQARCCARLHESCLVAVSCVVVQTAAATQPAHHAAHRCSKFSQHSSCCLVRG